MNIPLSLKNKEAILSDKGGDHFGASNHRKGDLSITEATRYDTRAIGKRIGVSTAAVSKWENELAYPDVTLFPVIAHIFEISIDTLFDYHLEDSETMDEMIRIKAHFEAEAKDFAQVILKLVPCYEKLMEAMMAVLPFERSESIKVIDLGCGTGGVAGRIKKQYPNAVITCMDISSRMVQMAQSKLAGASQIYYEVGDFYSYGFKQNYDLAISSLSLHHTVTDKDRKRFFGKIYDALKPQDCFYNFDLVLGSNEHVQQVYINKWKQKVLNSQTEEKIAQEAIGQYRIEGHPSTLMTQLRQLEEVGFKEIDVIMKEYNYAVFGGKKVE